MDGDEHLGPTATMIWLVLLVVASWALLGAIGYGIYEIVTALLSGLW